MDKKKLTKGIVYVITIVLIVAAVSVALWFTGGIGGCVARVKEERAKYVSNKSTTTAKDSSDDKLQSVIVTDDVIIDALESDEDELADIYNSSEVSSETASTTVAVANAEYIAKFTISNSWAGHYQYSVEVKNISSMDISNWEIKVEVPADCTVESNWCANCSISGNILTITPLDYNQKISAGDTITDIGITFACDSTMKNFEWRGEGIVVESESQEQSQSPTQSPTQKPTQEQQTTTAPNHDSYVPPVLEAGTPVSNHGKLSVKGVNLVDNKGNKFQLKGVSTHGISWFPEYVNKEGFRTLRDEWGANTIRLAMYTAEFNGYCTGGNQAGLKKTIEDGVKYATELGMYVIIDWHVLNDRNPNVYKAQAIAFFNEMSQKYADYNNVIYEICNEPNGGVSWNEIKTYADEVIGVIRKNDPDAIILVGTPTWSQDVDQVAANPVTNSYNVMYTLHFYAATHKDALWSKLRTAIAAGTPLFVSEFSICDASGNGGIDYSSAETWKSLINEYNLSFMGWSLSNKAETSALIKSGCTKVSGWTTEELSDTGKWLRNFIAGN